MLGIEKGPKVRGMGWSWPGEFMKGRGKGSGYGPKRKAGTEPLIRPESQIVSTLKAQALATMSLRETEIQAWQLKDMNSSYSIFTVQGRQSKACPCKSKYKT